MIKTKLLKIAAASLLATCAATANAGVVTLSGVIDNCFGLCLALSAPGKTVSATVFIPDADGTYAGSDLNGLHTPDIELEGNFSILTFVSELYTDAGATVFPSGPTLPTAAGADTLLSVSGGTASGTIAVAGIGATSGAPVWGAFNLDTGIFVATVFVPDTDGDPSNGETPGFLPLADGTFTVVPVPAAAWFMGSALLGLLGIRKKLA